MTTPRTCDACNGDLKGGISLGGTLLCRRCAPLVEAEIETLRSAGKPVSAPRIAARMRQGDLTDYLIRNIPADLWQRFQGAAARRNMTARELLMEAITTAAG